MLHIMFILVVAGVHLVLGVLVTALMYWFWGEEQGDTSAFPESTPVKEFPMTMTA